jgi:hypothetical protein
VGLRILCADTKKPARAIKNIGYFIADWSYSALKPSAFMPLLAAALAAPILKP